MRAFPQGDFEPPLKNSRSGLRDGDRRSLMRLLFVVSGSAFFFFSVLQLINGNILLASIELVGSVLFFTGCICIEKTRHLQVLIYTYLIALFSFFIFVTLLPSASTTTFFWVLMMPVLAYLLLGKRSGLMITVPFMVMSCLSYLYYIGGIANSQAITDLANVTLCALLMLSFIHVYEIRREEAENTLVELAHTDALTGLENRSSFHGTLLRSVAECQRSSGQFALVIMDVDHFKQVNDTYGHEVGDRVLCHISEYLSERLRATDSTGRLGGEEFGLILRDVSAERAFQLTDELRQRIEASTVSHRNKIIQVTASFGVAQWPEDGLAPEELLRTADRRLYGGKRSGRNVVFINDDEPGSFDCVI